VIWVGLTGGIASGKSTVSQFLRQEGAFIIDADRIAHRVILKGGEAYRPVVEAFGRAILDQSGEISRKKLGEIVFNDPEMRISLNRIVHPHVFEKADLEKAEIARRHPNAIIVFDAALLIETEAHLKMDWILLAYVDRATQIDRLIRRDGLSPAEAGRRIAAQMSLDDKIPFANEIIDNRKPLADVKEEVGRIYRRLQERQASVS
jgi:dephospho-CoA kinase